MAELLQELLRNTIILSVIGILMVVFTPFLSKRYSAKCLYYAWLVIVIALILPIRPQIDITLAQTPAGKPPYANIVGILGAISGQNSLSNVITAVPSEMPVQWYQIIGVLWLTGALCFLGWHIFHHVRFMNTVKRWSGAAEVSLVTDTLLRLKKDMGIKQEITIKSCACVKSPMMTGLLKPVILLPETDLSPEELLFILKHELVHYKRKDLWCKLLIMAALTIHWFNPIVHLMSRAILNQCEISCDEEVLKNADIDSRVRYGETIIGVIRSGSVFQTALSTNFYSGKRGIKDRVYAIMDIKNKRFSIFALMVVVILAVGGTSAFALSAPESLPHSDGRLTAVTTPSPDTGSSLGNQSPSLSDKAFSKTYTAEEFAKELDSVWKPAIANMVDRGEFSQSNADEQLAAFEDYLARLESGELRITLHREAGQSQGVIAIEELDADGNTNVTFSYENSSYFEELYGKD